jgi:hypothetical protein
LTGKGSACRSCGKIVQQIESRIHKRHRLVMAISSSELTSQKEASEVYWQPIKK